MWSFMSYWTYAEFQNTDLDLLSGGQFSVIADVRLRVAYGMV